MRSSASSKRFAATSYAAPLTPTDYGKPSVFASDDARFMTGADLRVDSGAGLPLGMESGRPGSRTEVRFGTLSEAAAVGDRGPVDKGALRLYLTSVI
jgi:hypothetical protein